MDRRRFLSMGALVGGALAARPAWAATSNRKFIFVVAQGGWDATRVFQPVFDKAGADLEVGAEPATAGGLPYVSHPMRPSVDTFFEAFGDSCIVLNGVLVPSIAHDICRMLILTGSVSGTRADWPAIIGTHSALVLPHVVIGGPSFPGDLGSAVARTGSFGQLEALLSGSALDESDILVQLPLGPEESLLDRWVGRRTAAWAAGQRTIRGQLLADALSTSLERATAIKELRWIVNFSGGADFASQSAVAVDLLARGVSRCVTLDNGGSPTIWDTHAQNDPIQSYLFEDLFYGLSQLTQMLALTPGETSPSLLDETVVCVLSEMGRTPQLNSVEGKDHWPYTSVLLIGGGLAGGRALGGLDDGFYGLALDPEGQPDPAGVVPDAGALGATLLELAEVDPDSYVDVAPIGGVVE